MDKPEVGTRKRIIVFGMIREIEYALDLAIYNWDDAAPEVSIERLEDARVNLAVLLDFVHDRQPLKQVVVPIKR